MQMINLTFVLSLNVCCNGNQLNFKAKSKDDKQCSFFDWHSTTNLNITMPMCALSAALIQLHHIRNLVNYGPVTPKIMRLECVQQAFQQVSLTVFTRQQQC